MRSISSIKRLITTLVGVFMVLGFAEGGEDVDQLIIQLKSESMEERREAAKALGELGPQAKAAVPALILAVSDPSMKYGDSPYVAPDAIRTLGKIGPDAAPAVDALLKVLGGEFWGKRIAATQALGKIGPKAAKSVPSLVRQWSKKAGDRMIAEAASASLVQIGPKAMAAVVTALDNDDPIVRTFAARTLGAFGVTAKVHMLKVDGMVTKEKDFIAKLEALNARLAIDPTSKDLGTIRKSISSLLPVVFKIFESQRSDEIRRALAVVAIGNSKDLALPLLDQMMTTAVSESDFTLRVVTGDAIAAIGEKALPKIRQWLKSDNIKIYETAVLATRAMGPAAKPALPELIALVERLGVKKRGRDIDEIMCCSYALDVIGSFGPSAKSALPVLKKLPLVGDDPKPDPIQRANSEAIQSIEGR